MHRLIARMYASLCQKAQLRYIMYAWTWHGIRTNVHTYICTYLHMCTHTYVHTYKCAHLHMYTQMCTLTYVHTYVHTYICTHICAHICMYVRCKDDMPTQQTRLIPILMWLLTWLSLDSPIPLCPWIPWSKPHSLPLCTSILVSQNWAGATHTHAQEDRERKAGRENSTLQTGCKFRYRA